MSKKLPKLVILDGNALIHRSFHAIPQTLTTKDGLLVNAVYGFAMALLKAIKDLQPEYLILTLDKKAPTFRHEKYTEYKATRIKAPDELYQQIPIVKDIAKAFNIPIYEQAGFEADDLIGTIATLAGDKYETIIVTGDMDALQLVNETTKVYSFSRGFSEAITYDSVQVELRYGLTPKQIIDFKALRGDTSDNIPGVKGIGEKIALELLQNFSTLECLYNNLDSAKIKPRIKQLLIDQKDMAYLSYELATIKLDVPLTIDWANALVKNYDTNVVLDIFEKLEFSSLISRFFEFNKGQKKSTILSSDEKFKRDQTNFQYILINQEDDFKKFFIELKKQSKFTFDTETTGLDNFSDKLLGISISWQDGLAYFIKIDAGKTAVANLFNYQNNQPDIKNTWLEQLKPIFENEAIKKSAHNAKFDIKILKKYDINVKGLFFDTMVASYLLNPSLRQHNLDGLAFSELKFEKINSQDLLGAGKNKITHQEVSLDKLAIYACEDADFTWRLTNLLEQKLIDQNLTNLFNNIELPLVEVLTKIELNGVLIDPVYLQSFQKQLAGEIVKLNEEIWKIAGVNFNINSPQQLQDILFKTLKINSDNITKTKTGLSTSIDELDKLQGQHEIIDLIIKYREIAKLNSTYATALPELINKKTGRIHTNYNQTVTSTGRLSSNEPNLQNIPIKTELGRLVRRAFIATPGYKLAGLDYSQIELRLAAYIAHDPAMIKAFIDKQDIHTATAAAINNVKLEEVTSDMRRNAKAINFGILYGQGAHGLAMGAKIPFGEAKKFIDQYFIAYPEIKNYIDNTIELAKTQGYVETLFGHKRYLPDINSTMPMVRKSAERMAINTPIQGSAADLIKIAMIEIHKLLADKYPEDAKMIMQVHDELVFEIKETKISEILPQLKAIMENVLKIEVPIIAESEIGDNWGEMK